MKFLKFAFFIIFISSTFSHAQEIIKTKDFNKNLYNELNKSEGNIVISPFSISSALLMAYIGSDTQTKIEFEKVLALDKDSINQIKKTTKN